MEVIVTDHHEPPDRVPGCTILHPRLSGYPCGELCATGVAYKLSVALLGAESARSDLDLVALATVADLVPLCGENRALVRAGLAEARAAGRVGLRALCAVARVEPARLDEGDLAFRLGPRINAAGRLYRADAGVELLLAHDSARATAIAAELDAANRERRDAERAVVDAAERVRAQLPAELASAPGLVLAGEGWHPGVVGIAASRLAERHGVPVVLIGIEGEAHAREALAGRDLVQAEPIDAVVGGESLGHDVAEQFGHLAPFGKGNPGVRLLVPSARVCDVRPMGDGDKHARFRLESGSHSALGVAFGVNGELSAPHLADPVDVSVKLELNEWNGAVEPRVVLGDLYPGVAEPTAGESPWPGDEEWWRRVAIERETKLEPWPSPMLLEASSTAWGRKLVDRRGASGVATVAAL